MSILQHPPSPSAACLLAQHCIAPALQELYTAALEVAPAEATQRAVYHCNRAACSLRLARHAEVVTDCSHALELDPTYGKALMRRAAAYEALDDLEHALLDFDKVGCMSAVTSVGQDGQGTPAHASGMPLASRSPAWSGPPSRPQVRPPA